jgi:2'-5' RNA ligase
MNCQEKSPHRLPLTIAFFLPPEALRLMGLFKRKLQGLCAQFENYETAHLTVKYVGYLSEGFSESHAISLIPRIAEIARPLVPVNVAIRGIELFENDQGEAIVAYMKVLSGEKLVALHEAIRHGLGNAVEAFPHADGPQYRPHITVSKDLLPNRVPALQKMVLRSKKSAKRHLRLTELVFMTPTAIYPIFPR